MSRKRICNPSWTPVYIRAYQIPRPCIAMCEIYVEGCLFSISTNAEQHYMQLASTNCCELITQHTLIRGAISLIPILPTVNNLKNFRTCQSPWSSPRQFHSTKLALPSDFSDFVPRQSCTAQLTEQFLSKHSFASINYHKTNIKCIPPPTHVNTTSVLEACGTMIRAAPQQTQYTLQCASTSRVSPSSTSNRAPLLCLLSAYNGRGDTVRTQCNDGSSILSISLADVARN